MHIWSTYYFVIEDLEPEADRMDLTHPIITLEAIMQELKSIREENAELRRTLAENEEEFRLKLQAVETAVNDRRTNTTPLTPSGLGTSTPQEEVSVPVPEQKPTQRPRPRLPDPALYEGKKSTWRGWKLEMENKLHEDADALGSSMSQFKYVYSRLSGRAKEDVTTFVEIETKRPEANPASLLNRLDLLYGDRDREKKAIQALHTLKQGENESFAAFYPRFEREIANANAEAWPDASKISYLRNALNDKLKMMLVPVNRAEINSYVGFATKCDELSNSMELLGQWRKPSSRNRSQPRASSPAASSGHAQPEVKREDMMEWDPTPPGSTQVSTLRPRRNNNLNGYPSKRLQDKALLGKRAKWVSQEEIDARRSEHRCLRCGRDDCKILTCPLAAPLRPDSQTHVSVTSARPRVTKAAFEDEESEDETSGGEQ